MLTVLISEGETADFLQKAGKFPNQALTTRLHHTHGEPFPRDLFAVIMICFILGMPAPPCLQKRGVTGCEACHRRMDRFGHHRGRMTCNQIASSNGSTQPHAHAHAHASLELANASADVARKSCIECTDKGVPTHLTNNKVGDALCNLSDGARKLVLDFTVVHPRSGSTVAKWNKNALAMKVRDKWNRHGQA
jgi:hypothetical protein